MPANPKKIREEDKEYLEHIRRQPGLIEGADIVVHHTDSVGSGGSDYLTVPIPFKHHVPGVHTMGEKTFQEAYNIDFKAEIIRLLISFIKEIKRTYPDKWFKKGQMSVKRKNKSGCCCEISDNDEVVSPCTAHLNWKEENENKKNETHNKKR